MNIFISSPIVAYLPDRVESELAREHGINDAKPTLETQPQAAAAFFHRALDVARRQHALAWELRAALSLARLWRDGGRTRDARELLAPIYSVFTEGFDMADLVAARTLLDELTVG